jgi:hypothetical protein
MGRRLPSNRLVKQLQQKTVDGFYGDSATIIQATVNTLDVYGQPNSVTDTSTTIAGSFTDKPNMELWKDFVDVERIEAEYRYAGTPALAKGNTITITTRFADANYTDKEYQVVGIRNRGAMGQVAALKAVA